MANFSPVRGLKFCCEYMMNFSPGANFEIAWEKSPENQNGVKDTTCENGRIASLAI